MYLLVHVTMINLDYCMNLTCALMQDAEAQRGSKRALDSIDQQLCIYKHSQHTDVHVHPLCVQACLLQCICLPSDDKDTDGKIERSYMYCK